MIPRSRPASPNRKLDSAPPAPDPALAPSPETLTVTDLDIEFASGSKYNLTLGPDDVLGGDERQLYITFATGEKIEIARAQIAYMSTRARTVVKQPAAFKPSATEVGDAARTN
jgi:hypothetical protein